MPSLNNFQLCESTIPELKENEVLVRTLYLSLDPYMRGRLGGRPSIHPPFPLNQPANGDGVGIVESSAHPHFQPGDSVCGTLDWADYSSHLGNSLRKFDPEETPPPIVLSVLGMSAMTAYFGLLDLGKPQPKDTVLISAAAGAVGMLVGQIAKIKGCKVIGLTGSDAKVKYLQELGFDGAINYKSANWIETLDACGGFDVYFDNVGGSITDEAMKRLNMHARVVLCGQISSYNLELPDSGPRLFRHLIAKSASAHGLLVIPDYQERFPEGRKQLQEWLEQGLIKPCISLAQGLENLPSAFLGLFSGDNLGKQLVQI